MRHLRAQVRRARGRAASRLRHAVAHQSGSIASAHHRRHRREISERVGYASPAAFGKAFRRHMRMSPGAYRTATKSQGEAAVLRLGLI